jgi:predicted TIM-barrel fold metal-dependent hydrolase
MIAVMDASGVQKAFALSNAYQWGMDFLNIPEDEEYEMVKFENDFTAREAAKYPDRLFPFLSINPLKDYAIAEIDRCARQLDLHALKLHFTNSDVDLRKPEHLVALKNVLSHADRKNMPVLIHFLTRNPQFGADDAQIFLDEIVSRLPNLKIQMAHLGCGGLMDKMIEMFDAFIKGFEKNPSLNKNRFMMDLAAVISDGSKPLTMAVTPEQAERITDQIRCWGVDKVLFATDWPIFEPAEYVDMINRKLNLTQEELETIAKNKWLV